MGVGLIGGSVGLAAKKSGAARTVTGVFRSRVKAREALRRGAVDEAVFDLAAGAKGADLVVLCSPVPIIIKQLRALRRALAPGALIIDTGSSKKLIGLAASRFLSKKSFVGCHPMAGSSRTGIEYAKADLFKNSQCFVTRRNPKITAFWKRLGSAPIVIGSREHDEWAAGVSYLTHLAAFALVGSKPVQKLLRMGLKAENPGFGDAGRLSKSSPELWADILMSNRANTVKFLKGFQSQLAGWQRALALKDRKKMIRLIREANRISARLAP